MASAPSRSRAAAKLRVRELLPQMASYDRLATVLWPFLTATSTPGYVSPHVNTDARGNRVTRQGTAEVRSDAPPGDAAFLLGGSYAFGVGASSDETTLAAALWRQTSIPFVNLGSSAGTSAQGIVSILPFVDRTTTFVVCNGLNNLLRAAFEGAGLDPIFGPTAWDRYLRHLSTMPIREVATLTVDPLARTGWRELCSELVRPRGTKKRPPVPKRTPNTLPVNDAARLAAARQLHDLRTLRRAVPDDASVVFALPPLAPAVAKEWLAEEQELLELFDLIQNKKWHWVKSAFFDQWPFYTDTMRRGCEELGVPLVDLSTAEFDGWCFIDPFHHTDRGYKIAAESIARAIADCGGLQAPVERPHAHLHRPVTPAAAAIAVEAVDLHPDGEVPDNDGDSIVYPR